jgi:hypothetical protein
VKLVYFSKPKYTPENAHIYAGALPTAIAMNLSYFPNPPTSLSEIISGLTQDTKMGVMRTAQNPNTIMPGKMPELGESLARLPNIIAGYAKGISEIPATIRINKSK